MLEWWPPVEYAAADAHATAVARTWSLNMVVAANFWERATGVAGEGRKDLHNHTHKKKSSTQTAAAELIIGPPSGTPGPAIRVEPPDLLPVSRLGTPADGTRTHTDTSVCTMYA